MLFPAKARNTALPTPPSLLALNSLRHHYLLIQNQTLYSCASLSLPHLASNSCLVVNTPHFSSSSTSHGQWPWCALTLRSGYRPAPPTYNQNLFHDRHRFIALGGQRRLSGLCSTESDLSGFHSTQ